ncbi:HAD-IA family hydrolase [bacterium]|nr:HAD-IA family hydrolase [bacterium]
MEKIYLFDWGDTIMKDFPDETGAMHCWQKVEAMPNAGKMLRELSRQADCYLATNAKDSSKEDIIKALQRVDLHNYFKDIFCFHEIGYAKPSTQYFDSIVKRLNISRKDMVMIGDNPDTDIKGAEEYGIDSILYDYDDKYRDYQGARIVDLMEILK